MTDFRTCPPLAILLLLGLPAVTALRVPSSRAQEKDVGSEATYAHMRFHQQASSAHLRLWRAEAEGNDGLPDGDPAGFLKALEGKLIELNRLLPLPGPGPRRGRRRLPSENEERYEIALVTSVQLQALSGQRAVELRGFVDPEINRLARANVLFLSPGGGFDSAAIHYALHELFHLHLYRRKPGESLWVHEGLSQLLAWRLSGLKPIGGIDDFLKEGRFRSLVRDSPADFTLFDYGQSFLFFRYLWSNYGGDRIFSAVRSAKARGIDGIVEAILALNPGAPLDFSRLFTQFALSLSLPGPSNLSFPGWMDQESRGYARCLPMPETGTLPAGGSYALVDMTDRVRSGAEFHIEASEPLKTYLIEKRESGTLVLPLDDDLQRPRDTLPAKVFFLVVNPSDREASFKIR